MQIVYLGLLSTVFNWVFNKILSPIIEFLAGILSTVLEWVFNAVLPFLLEAVFWPIFYAVLDIIMALLGEIFYLILIELFEVLDALQTSFEIFAGITDVTLGDTTGSLLEVIFLTEGVQQGLLGMILIGFVLSLFFSIISTLRSMGDFGEQKMPVSKVVASTMKSLLYLVCIPTVMVLVISMSTIVLRQVNSAIGGADTRLSANIFIVSSLDAANSAAYNISGVSASNSNNTAVPLSSIGQNDAVRSPYYNLESGYSYKSLTDVKKNFTPGSFDYLIGYGGTAFIIFALGMCIFTFITRIFEVLLMILVAPLFAAMMPLDGGEKFKSWQEMFVGKIFSGYGAVVAMQLYLLIAPLVMGGGISFGDGSTEANYLIRLIFLIGSAWTVTKAGPVVTQLFSYQAGMAEHAAVDAYSRGMSSVGRMASGATRNLYGKAKNSIKDRKAKNAQGAGGEEDGSGEGQAFTGGVDTNRTLTGVGTNQDGETATKPKVKMTRPTLAQVGVQKEKPAGSGHKVGLNFGADGAFKGANLGQYGFNRSKKADNSMQVDAVKLPFMTLKRDTNGNMKISKFGISKALSFRRGETITKNADGTTSRKLSKNFGLHAALGITRDNRQADGSIRAEDVRTRSFMGSTFKGDSDGKLKLSSMNFGMGKIKRAETQTVDENGNISRSFGDLYVSSIPVLGYNRSSADASGSQTDRVFGVNISHEKPTIRPSITNNSTTPRTPPSITNNSTTPRTPPSNTNNSTTTTTPPSNTNNSTTTTTPPSNTNNSTTTTTPPSNTNNSTTTTTPPSNTNNSTTTTTPPSNTNNSSAPTEVTPPPKLTPPTEVK